MAEIVNIVVSDPSPEIHSVEVSQNAAHAATHYDGHGDELDIKQLGGFPGGTSSFLRADGSFATVSGSGQSEDELLKQWTAGECYQATSATFDSDGVVSSATVLWPDGASGTFTRTAKNSSFSAVDAYTVTHATFAKTVTQSTVTRDSSGNVTTKPALTVA